MSDLLNIGSSALLAYRSALDTVGHNIANANTPGYSRQRVELQARTPTQTGYGSLGSGVEIGSSVRLTDKLVAARLVEDSSSYSRISTFQQLSSRIDSLLSGSETGLSTPLQSFFTSASALASNPSSTAARQALLAAGDGLAARFADLQGQFDNIESGINSALAGAVDEVNGYASRLAELNNQIALAQGSGRSANDLLDQRDQALGEIANRIGVTTFEQADGSLSVFVAGGQALVLGANAQKLALADDAYRSGRQEIVLGNSGVNVSAQLSGGIVGGLLDARSQLLDPLQNQLGRIAVGFAQSVNAQNAQGADQTGALGGPLFALPAGSAYAATANGGSASVGVGFSNVAALTGDDYVLRYDGSAWSLSNAKTGTAVPMTGSGSAVDPFVGAGLSLVVGTGAVAGDRYSIQPLRHAAGQVALATTDPAAIAAASPVRSAAAPGNTGSGSISAPTILDATNPALQNASSISFTSATSYTIDGNGPYTYSAGADIDANGWRVQISGTPAAGDTFNLSATAANSGGNANALKLAGLGNGGVLDGGRSSLIAAGTSLVGKAGGIAQQATLRRDAQAAIQAQTQSERDAVSGVNLDEEAADMVRYQQAYQAAARIIAVADELFQSLLDAAR